MEGGKKKKKKKKTLKGGNKGRARICHEIREKKGILTSVVKKFNRVVPSTETVCLETIQSGKTATT